MTTTETAAAHANAHAHPGEPAREPDAAVRLDASQKAVLDLDPTVSAMVIGAPGTGKTTTLIELVAHRVGTHGAPSSVLAIASSRTSATTLRDRLAARLGRTTAGPLARTAHSLAFDIVASARRAAGEPAPRLLSGGDQDNDIAQLLAGHLADGTGPTWPDTLGPEVRALRTFRTELRDLMMRATERGITPDRLRVLGHEHHHPEWVAAADFITEYRAVLGGFRDDQYDPAELAVLAAELLDTGHTSELVAALGTLVIDDLHEATLSTINLLAALARRGIAIVAFGDPDVATSTFRGGDPRIVSELGSRLGVDTLTLTLEHVHRQTPQLRELTSRVIARIGTAGTVGHRAAQSTRADAPASSEAPHRDGAPPVLTIAASSPARERAAIARHLRERHVRDDVGWSDMAVIVRSGALVPAVARALNLADVPTRTTLAAQPVRDDAAARALLTIVDVGIGRSPLTADTCVDILTGPFGGLDRLSLRTLRLALRAEEFAGDGHRSSDELLIDALSTPGRLVTIDHRVGRHAARIADTLALVRDAHATGASIEEFLWIVWERSGLATEWKQQALGSGLLAAGANRNLDGILALFTAAKRFVERDDSAGARVFLDQILDAEVPEDTLSPQSVADTVLITTPAGATGLEFDTVVVASLNDGVWPNLKLRGSLFAPDLLTAVADGEPPVPPNRTDVLHDELRMFALAVSRATHQVVLSASENDDEQASVFLTFGPEPDPVLSAARSPLTLRGLVGTLRRELTRPPSGPYAPDVQAAAASGLAQLAAADVPGAHPDTWHGLLDLTTADTVFADDEHVHVSPSKLESVEESAVDWFISSVAGSQSSNAMGLGTIIHAVMERGLATTADDIWHAIDERWNELVFESPWLDAVEQRKARAAARGLAGYLAKCRAEGIEVIGTEQKFRVELGRALVSGMIDRIERAPDGTVTIVDLKTGANAPAKPQLLTHAQLAAYQLALAHSEISDPEGRDIRPGGAKLVHVRTKTNSDFTESAQAPFTPDQFDQIRARIIEAAQRMDANTFDGPYILDEYAFDIETKRIHRVKAVSSD